MKKIFLHFSAIILFTSITWAQYGSIGSSDARSMSLGNTYNMISRGVYSIGINPSNLIVSPDNSLEFNTVLPIPFLSLGTGTNFINLKNVNYYFGKVNDQPRILTENDKQNLNSLFANGGLVFINTSLNLLSVTYKADNNIGAFGFAMKDVLEGEFHFPHEVTNLLTDGNLINHTYNTNDAKVNAWWIREYSLSYARQLPDLGLKPIGKINVGISLKLVNGFFYLKNESINSYLQTTNDYRINLYANNQILGAFSNNFGFKYSNDTTESHGNGTPFPSPAGTGFGMDIGFNSTIFKVWNVSLALTDIGGIHWNENTTMITDTGSYTINDISQSNFLDTLKNKFNGEKIKTGSFSSGLPTALRLGVSYNLDINHNSWPGRFLFAFDYNQGLNNEPGNSLTPRFSVGAEWKPMDWIPFVRSGFSFGGLLGFHWGFGLGIETSFLEFNIGTLDLQSLLAPNSGKYFSVAIDSRWMF